MEEKLLTVSEVSRKTGISVHTIRFYCDKGLVPMVQRDRNNSRLFSKEAVDQLVGSQHLRQSGMSLPDIKQYVELRMLGDDALLERYEIMKRQHKLAKAQLEEAKERLKYLERKLKDFEQTLREKNIK